MPGKIFKKELWLALWCLKVSVDNLVTEEEIVPLEFIVSEHIFDIYSRHCSLIESPKKLRQ